MTDNSSDTTDFDDPAMAARELLGLEGQLQGLVVHTAVDLGIIELVAEESLPEEEILSTLRLNPDFGARLIRALRVFGVLEETPAGTVGLSPVGEYFTESHPESLRDVILYFYYPARLQVLRHLPDIVSEGRPYGFPREHDMGVYEYMQHDSEMAAYFNGFQTSNWGPKPEGILQTLSDYGLADVSTICDVGGGHGIVLSHLLREHPHLEGIVLDLPHAIEEQHRHWAPKLDVADRCTYMAGDMFEAIPEADAYFLSSILHNWDDEDCITILENIHTAAPDSGRLFVYEQVVADGEANLEWTLLDILMLLEVGGRERTHSEFAALFERAGWRLEELLDADGSHGVMVGEKT